MMVTMTVVMDLMNLTVVSLSYKIITNVLI